MRALGPGDSQPGAQLVILTVSGFPEKFGQDCVEDFRSLGKLNVAGHHVATRVEANARSLLELVDKTDSILFTGGAQPA